MGRPMKSVALAGLATLLGGNSGAEATSSLSVFDPGAVVLGRAFVLEWESVGLERFDIMLYPNSASCDGSGEPLDLCGKSNGCADSQGDMNVVVPAEAGVGERESQPPILGCYPLVSRPLLCPKALSRCFSWR